MPGIKSIGNSLPWCIQTFSIKNISGKKINRPVANYDYCHNLFSSYINSLLNGTSRGEKNEDSVRKSTSKSSGVC